MSRTYRAQIFASFYCGVIAVLAMIWVLLLTNDVPHGVWKTAGTVWLIVVGILGAPWMLAKVTIDDEGITQQVLRRRFVRWSDIVGWTRTGHPGSDGPDTIVVMTGAGSFRLTHNCVFGKRLDDIEAELRRRIRQPTTCENN